MNKEKYTEKLQMDQFKRIVEISSYNYNYYIGFEKDLLFAKSDDDDTTVWWLIANGKYHYLGESHTSQGDLLVNTERGGKQMNKENIQLIGYLMVTIQVLLLCCVLVSYVKLTKVIQEKLDSDTVVILVRESGMTNKDGEHNTAIYSGYGTINPSTTSSNNVAIQDSIKLRDKKYYDTPNPSIKILKKIIKQMERKEVAE